MKPSRSRCIRSITAVAANCRDLLLRFDYLLSTRESNFDQSQEAQIRAALNHKVVICYVHFSSNDQIDEIDQEVIEFLRKNSYKVLVFSNCQKIANFSGEIVYAKNLGRDLGLYRDIARVLSANHFSGKLVLLNNSVAWIPGTDFIEMLNFLTQQSGHNAVSGVMDSWQTSWHVQSFAFGIDFTSESSKIIFSKVRNVRMKRTLVRYGEIALGQNLLNHGFNLNVMIDYKNLISLFESGAVVNPNRSEISGLIRAGVHLNPSQHFWSECIALGFPGLKRSLVESNPADLRSTPDFLRRIG